MNTVNEYADYWRNQIGVNVIPADTRNKKTWIKWSEYQDKPIPVEMHEHWKRNDNFKDGMAIIAGKVWHNPDKKGLYLAFIDLDNQKAVDEFCTKDGVTTSLEEFAKHMIVEQHKDDLTRAHIYCYTSRPLIKKSSDLVKSDDSPAFEVKGLGEHGIAYCSPSLHKNGSKYEIIGTFEPTIEAMDGLEGHIDSICRKYGISYLSNGHSNNSNITELFKTDKKVYEGHNRHGALLTVMCSLIKRNHAILSEETIKDLARKENQRLCEPPLDETEFEKQWKCAVKFIEKKNGEQEEIIETQKSISVLEAKRKHSGTWTVLGKIVTVSEMYVVEVEAIPPDTGIIYKDARSIQLEDIEKLDENERLDVTLYNDDINNVVAGEVVEIIGNNELVGVAKKNSKVKRVVINATSIKYVNRKELVIRPEDIKTFEKFAFDCKEPNCDWSLRKRLISMFAPNVVGHDDAKEGLLLSIVGGDDHGQRGGGRINTFLVGDPGTAKSTLGEEVATIKPNSRHVSAPHASSKTITAIAEKENESVTLRLGAIPLSRNAICAIDEVTSFSHEEQARLLDVLEMGIIPLDKHGRHWTIPAPTTIIATANPIQSRWTDKNIVSKNEIDMIKTLQDRFQQTFVFRDVTNREQIAEYTKQMSIIRKRRPHNYNFLRKYLIYASTIEVRKITPEAEYMLNQFWEEAKALEIVGFRVYRDLFIIAEAYAKLQLKGEIDEEIAKETIESVQLRMVQHGQTVKTPSNPKVVTYNKFVEILQNNKVGVTVKSLCEIACKEDLQISEYIGKNWSMKHNVKVRVVIGMLRNHSDVKVIQGNPVVLQWVLGDKGDKGDSDSDTVLENMHFYDNSGGPHDKRNEENNVKSEMYHLSQLSPLSPSNTITQPITQILANNWGLMVFFKGSIFLNHLQYGLRTCVHCGEVIDSFYMKIHNCEVDAIV